MAKASLRTPPRFLYRVSSWEGRKKTNGYDSLTLHIPAAHVNHDEKCHDTIYDIPNGLSELKEMLGRRFFGKIAAKTRLYLGYRPFYLRSYTQQAESPRANAMC